MARDETTDRGWALILDNLDEPYAAVGYFVAKVLEQHERDIQQIMSKSGITEAAVQPPYFFHRSVTPRDLVRLQKHGIEIENYDNSLTASVMHDIDTLRFQIEHGDRFDLGNDGQL